MIDVATHISAGPPARRSRFWTVAGAVVVAALVVGAWGITEAWAPRRAAANEVDSEVRELKRRLNELELEQGRQRMVSRSLVRTVEKQQEERGGTAATPEPEDKAPPAPRPSAQEQYRTLESKFAAENIDGPWAVPTESRIREVVATFKGTRLLTSSCRSSMCRLELSFADMEAREEFEAQSVQQVPFTNTHVWMQRSRGEDGMSFSTVMLVSRGGPLPVL